MKPVAIFRHAAGDGPGYFYTHLERRGVPRRIIRIDAGDVIPGDASAFSGIGLMGGPMSANDPLPWVSRLIDLVRAAVAADVPVIGHCLGGQLLSKALEGEVSLNPVKEIGWGEVAIADTPLARSWFGETRSFLSFHWHGETFSIPRGAELIASSRYCRNQAFAVERHLGLQCHVEMTPAMVRAWCRSGAAEIGDTDSPAVQTPAAMRENLNARIEALNGVAGRLYDRWLEGFG